MKEIQKTFSIFDMFSNAFPFLLKETFFFKLIHIERIKKGKGRVKSKACKYPTTKPLHSYNQFKIIFSENPYIEIPIRVFL